jgi:xylulokinase
VRRVETVDPDPARAEKYENLFGIYKRIYDRTHSMMAELEAYADE